MTLLSFQIRVCLSCGLRYPLTEGHSFGERCPQCLGETKVISQKQIDNNPITKEKKRGIKEHKTKAVLLDNIRSAWNVGSILRSADGFGFSHAYLCGITPTPDLEAVRKTALGADEYVTWSAHKDAVKLIKGLKKENWKIFALEEHERAISIRPPENRRLLTSTDDIVLILGNEVTGVDSELLDLADKIFYIPMHGQKRSFNVANAFSIAAYALSSV